jgi:hypothetical protein
MQGGRELRNHIRPGNPFDVHAHWHIGDPDQHNIATAGERKVRVSAANRRLPVRGAAGRAGFSNQLHRVGGDSQAGTQQHPYGHMRDDVTPAVLKPTEGSRTVLFRRIEDAGSETSGALALIQCVDEPQRQHAAPRGVLGRRSPELGSFTEDQFCRGLLIQGHHGVNVRRPKSTVQPERCATKRRVGESVHLRWPPGHPLAESGLREVSECGDLSASRRRIKSMGGLGYGPCRSYSVSARNRCPTHAAECRPALPRKLPGS